MANGWTVGQKSLKLATRLQGEALTAYKDIPMDDRKNYDIVKAALQGALIPEEGKFIAMDAFHTRSLFPSESVQIYVYELKKLINRALPDIETEAKEQLLFHRFVTGLPVQMSREIQLNSSITSLGEAVKRMTYENKQTDSICSIIKDSKAQEGQPLQKPLELQRPESQIANLEESISELSIQLANLRSEGAVMSTVPMCTAAITSHGDRKPVVCYNCRKKCHIARNCRTKVVFHMWKFLSLRQGLPTYSAPKKRYMEDGRRIFF